VTSILDLFAAMQETTQAPSSGPGSFFLIQMGLIFAIIYFLLLRPRSKQEKRLRERVAELRKGDEVITTGGIIGEVVHLKEDRVTLKSGEARLVVMRDRIAHVPSAESKQEKAG
jgi:preprotein translocase subunit YajC